MKLFYIISCLIILSPLHSTFCQQAKTGEKGININYLSPYNSKGLPQKLERDDIDLTFIADIDSSLPEDIPVSYIDPSIETSIILTSQASVSVTFIYKSSYHKNSLGFYLYNVNNPPKKPSDIHFHTIIFPNISTSNEGGDIFNGNRVNLGTFQANTCIGWFIISDGWSVSEIVSGRQIYYSNYSFNPESVINKKAHMILLNDPDRQKFIIGFEDDIRDINCDDDFNDVVLSVDISPYTSVQKSNIAVISNSKQAKVDSELAVNETVDVPVIYNEAVETLVSPDSIVDIVSDDTLIVETNPVPIENIVEEVVPDEIVTEKSPCEGESISYKEFSNVKATVQVQPAVSSKRTIMKRMLNGQFISVSQVSKLLALFEEENDKLEMAEFLYSITCNQLEFNSLSSLFSGSSLKKFEAFLQINGVYASSSSNENESTTSATTAVNAVSNCNNPVKDEKQFKRFVNSIRSRSFASEKYLVVNQEVEYNCFTVAQVIDVISLFIAEVDKLELSKYLYDYTVDSQSYVQLINSFSLDSSIQEFTDFLNSKD